MGGAASSSSSGLLDRVLDDHCDALFDFALAVTGGPDDALAAVRQAVPSALETHGPGVTRAALLGSVLTSAVRLAEPPGALPDDLLGSGPDSPAGIPDFEELRRVSREATRVLDPRDRGILDLALRQGLEGKALGEALGVSPGQVSAATQSAVEQAEHIVGAVLLTRLAREDCPGLAGVLDAHIEADAGKLAAAVLEHQEVCDGCGDRRRALVPVASLLASVPPTPAPAELRRAIGFRRIASSPRAGVSPRLRPLPRQAVVVAAMAAACLLGGVAVVALREGPPRPPTASPGGGRIALPAGQQLDLGPTGMEGSFEIANTGRQPLEFRAVTDVPWLQVVGAEGLVEPGGRAVVGAVLDRARAPEGEATAEIRIRSSGGRAVVPVRATVERAPVISAVGATPESVVHVGCPGATPSQVRVAVAEESGVRRAELGWRGTDGVEQVVEMAKDGESSFLASLGPFASAGDVTFSVAVTDIRGNGTLSPAQVLSVSGC